jgi:uncharacterized radical SAM superfamily protein
MSIEGHGRSEADDERATRAMEVRRAGFADDVYFYLPSLKHYETDEVATPDRARFVPVSVTGRGCQLMCDHCQAKILDSMHPVGRPEDLVDLGGRLAAKGVTGVLVTGGSDADGTVPLAPYADAMRELKERFGFTVIVHTGLLGSEDARALARAGIDAAMIDIIGSNETVRNVYHLDADVKRFDTALGHLADAGVPTAPHVVIGIHYGEILGERHALEMISRHPVASLVLVVLSPIPGTPMDGERALTGDDLAELFADARLGFPATPVLLGCARPEGGEKYGIDEAALAAGLNGIAFPADGIVSRAKEMGLTPHFSHDCCALIFREVRAKDVARDAVRR